MTLRSSSCRDCFNALLIAFVRGTRPALPRGLFPSHTFNAFPALLPPPPPSSIHKPTIHFHSALEWLFRKLIGHASQRPALEMWRGALGMATRKWTRYKHFKPNFERTKHNKACKKNKRENFSLGFLNEWVCVYGFYQEDISKPNSVWHTSLSLITSNVRILHDLNEKLNGSQWSLSTDIKNGRILNCQWWILMSVCCTCCVIPLMHST